MDSSNGHSQRTKPKKSRRKTRACDFCHHRSVRCKISTENSTRCQNCVDFDVTCTYERPVKKRGKKVSGSAIVESEASLRGDDSSPNLQHFPAATRTPASQSLENGSGHPGHDQLMDADDLVTFPLSREVRELVLTNRDKIANLINIYFEIIYPIFPFFHKPSLLPKVVSRTYLTDRSLFVSIMSICTLASARARDGALLPGRWDPSYFCQPTAEVFFEAAREGMPKDLGEMRSLEYMRGCALLALYGVQIGKVEVMHQYLGVYHSLVAVDGLHDEKNWPNGVGVVEMEERRRLFWSIYTLEVYYSIVWGGVIRCRESQSRVAYPSEIDDEFLSEESLTNGLSPSTPSNLRHPSNLVKNPSCWLHGWNFTTDMYRILEHTMNDFHRRRHQIDEPFSPSELFRRDTPPQSVVLEKVMWMHDNLPARFKESRNVVGEMSEDIFGFQAANITATLQLVRMVLFTTEQSTTVNQKCTISSELLEGLSKVPLSFMKAISSPLFYHLAGIGSILGSVMIENPLSESDYRQVRKALLDIADLLARLENTMARNVGANERLRNLITRIDEFMMSQRRQELLPAVQNQVPANNPSMGVNSILNSFDGNVEIMATPRWDGPQNAGPSGGMVQLQGTQGFYSDIGEGSDNQFQFQIPPELLEDWPWTFDMGQGFGQFGME